jgi:hypothetical protein
MNRYGAWVGEWSAEVNPGGDGWDSLLIGEEQHVPAGAMFRSDGVLSSVLKRLVEEGWVTKERRGANHVVYSATPLTRRRMERLRRISEIAANIEPSSLDDH